MQTCPLLGIISKKICSKQLDSATLTIIYKLLHDSLLVIFIFFIFTLIAEAILPTIITSHIGFSKLLFLLLGNILLLKFFAKKITPVWNVKNFPSSSIKILIPLSILGTLLILNSQLGINIFLNVFILIIAGAIGYLSYQILFHEE